MVEPTTVRRNMVVLLAVVLIATVFIYPMFLDIPLLDPDEGLYASVAQEMVERGDYVVPSRLGEPFLDRPIFFLWFEAASLKVFGFHAWVVRLPSLMFGLLGSLVTGLAAWRMFSRTAGIIAGLLYTTMVLPIALAQATSPDVALVPVVVLGILGFWEADRAQSLRAKSLITAGLGLVLAVSLLTKGLVGIAMIGLSYGLYLLLTRRLTLGACARGICAMGIGAAIASCWYLAVEARHPGYLQYYFIDRHLLGFATTTQHHGSRPVWYYLPILIGGGMPWILYLPALVRDSITKRLVLLPCETNGAMTLCWTWLIACTILMSLAGSKLVTYIWPIFPVVAILAAVAWQRLYDGELTSGAKKLFHKFLVASCHLGPVVLPIAMITLQMRYHVTFSLATWVVASFVAAICFMPLLFWYSGRYRETLAVSLVAMAAQFTIVMTILLPVASKTFSTRTLAEHFNRAGEVPPRMLVTEERLGSFVFYLKPELRAKLHAESHKKVELEELRDEMDESTLVIVPDNKLKRAKEMVDLRNVPYQKVGRHRLYEPETIMPRIAIMPDETSRLR